MSHSFPFRKVYGPVIVLAVIAMYGLLSALFGDGVWYKIACAFLAIPLTVIVWKGCHSQG